ncbi:MAG: mandelate racemase/muconate lactonizing enzyme family protein, partial [Lentisphaeria bacterium]|nr:mandelate racemase/muconate lactonizing enzyme family protein [Lentisphaeria bacterium]
EEWDCELMHEMQIDRVHQLKELGYLAFKMEPMMSSEENILELARRGREAIGPDLMMSVDVGYRFDDVPSCVRICKELEKLDTYFFETPFPIDSTEPYARLAEQTTIPLAMGEHGVGRWEFLDMIKRGKLGVAQPYMNTCGGITEAKRIVEQAMDYGALVIPGNWSTQILGAATVHLAAYSRISPYVEFAPADVFDSPLRQHIQDLSHPVVDGVIKLPTIPGIGIELPEDLVKGFTLDL